jgi:hypothetical protein
MENAYSRSQMESLPKLDTSPTETFTNSTRNSYASTVDSHPPSARSSYISNSDTTPSSSRSSYSSLQDSFGRVSSFSRTSYEFSPDSVTITPISSRDSSPDSPTRWGSEDLAMKFVSLLSLILCISDKPGPCENFLKSPLKIKIMKVMESLPRTDRQLSRSSKMYGILCVSRSEPFDRYYISWEDNDGKFYQGMPLRLQS